MNLITGNNFKDLCDIECLGSSVSAMSGKQNPSAAEALDQYMNMFTEGHNLKKALWHCSKMAQNKFIVISHNSDANILDHPGRDFDFHYVEAEIPNNVKMIYAQNLDVLSSRIRPLPIGVENWKWHKGTKYAELKALMEQDHPRDKWLYVNHAIETNHAERYEPYMLFDRKDWATTKGKVSYLEYLTDLKQHKFRICPFGNGFDTHSIWETLYMGCIPIVKRAVFTEMFSRIIIPFIVVNDWKEINLEILKESDYSGRVQTKLMWHNKNNPLDFSFWQEVIAGKVEIS